MERQFDFRALLLKIQDRLSNDDRHRLHFLVGDIIPRMQRENVTLAGTLTLLESLFDRAVINEDYLDFLIRIFTEIQCYDAVTRLREFQSPNKRTLTVSDILDDNLEEDKHQTIDTNQSTLDRKNSMTSYETNISNKLVNEFPVLIEEKIPLQRPTTTTESFPLTPNTEEEPTEIVPPSKRRFFQFSLIKCLYLLFFLQMLLVTIYFWIFIRKKLSLNYVENRYQQEAYIIKNGKFLDNIEGKWFNHSEDLLLTYTDRLMRIDAHVNHDDMYSIKFLYTQNKSLEHTLKNSTRLTTRPTLSSLDIQQRSIQEISQCYRNESGSIHLVGLYFAFKDKSSMLFGSCHQQIYLEDKLSNHIFGYAAGKTSQYLNGLQFFWYKICPVYSRVTFCANHNPYRFELKDFYKD